MRMYCHPDAAVCLTFMPIRMARMTLRLSSQICPVLIWMITLAVLTKTGHADTTALNNVST